MRRLLLQLGLGLSLAANAAEAPWTAIGEDRLEPGERGLLGERWLCTHRLRLHKEVLLICRAPRPGARWTLLHLRAAAQPPQRLAVLGDASQFALRAFVPPGSAGCDAGQACTRALLWVDHGDEGGCYGSLLWVRWQAMRWTRVGLVPEWRPQGDSALCLGSHAQVSPDTAGLSVRLPAPLARTDRFGNPQTLDLEALHYRIRLDAQGGARLLRGP